MRPIKLELSGLNSYIEKSTIDFQCLTEIGLFGIFGKTGSGKSTILDAMTMAMYGNIPRNTKEFINTSCDKAIISYEFEIGNKNSKRKYKIDRTIVRTNTGTKTSYARLIEIYNNEEKVLADKVSDVNAKVTEIIGLTANDFTRSVVLPQGKFNDFLKLTGSDRRDMLERIFNLEKYGRILIDRVRKRKNIQLQNLRDINTKLSQYDTISEDVYKEIEKDLENLKVNEVKLNKEFDNLQNKYVKLQEIYEKQTKLEKNENRKKELDLRSNEMVLKNKQLEDAINASKIEPYINSVLELEKRINEDSYTSENLDKKVDILSKELLITKANYEQAYKNRNDKMPKLTEEKTKIQLSMDLEEELITLDKDLKQIKEKGLNLSKEKEVSLKLKNEYDSKKEYVVKTIKELEDSISKLKIRADLKQKIFLAYDYEKEYNKIVEEKVIKESELSESSKHLEDISLKIKYIQRDKEILSKDLKELENSYEFLLTKCPGENEEIISKIEYITNLKSQAQIVKESEEKRDVLQDLLNQILESKYQIEREISSLNEKLEVNKKNKDYIKEELEKLRYLNLAVELRKELKENYPCPVCGSKHHGDLELVNYDENIEFTNTKLQKLKQEETNIKQEIEELKRKCTEYVSIEKIRLKEFEEIKSKIGDLNSNYLLKKFEDETRIVEILKASIQRWQKEKEEMELKINKIREAKNDVEKKELKLQESINTYKKSVSEIKLKLELINSKFNKSKDEYLNLKSVVKVQNLGEKVEQINRNEKALEDLNIKYMESSKIKEGIEKEIVDTQNALHNTELELITAREIYSEKKKIRDEKYKEIITITKGESSKVLLRNLEELVNDLIKQEESIKVKLEQQRIECERYISEKSNLDGRLKIAKEQYKIQLETLNKSLQDYKFDNIYAVKRAILESDVMKKLHNEITEYEEELKVLNLKIKELKDNLGDKKVKIDEFEELKNRIYSLKIEIGDISKDIGGKESILTTLKKSLEKVKDLNKELKVVKHKVDLLDDLDKIVQGNRFVEYVATNQLKYIALEASKRLESITKGRYSLEIDSTLNFVMRDNFNGGQRRSVDTLSGGETFLTSLSLAIALSSQIQLKGSAPLEFFFLDEGFGSLDSELLEVVIESLERLHNDKLSVGIITHVEDLKNRVPIKLIVSSSKIGKGSSVKIEYS